MPISQNRARRARTRRFTPGLETLERREVFSVTPYLLAVAPSVQITPIMTVGDSVAEADAATDMFDNSTTPQDGQYRMAGLPDGLGAFDNGDDLIKNMQLWNSTSYVSGTTVLNRLCSADLPEVSAFYNAATGKGTTTEISWTARKLRPDERSLTWRAARTPGRVISCRRSARGLTKTSSRTRRLKTRRSLSAPTSRKPV